MKTLKTITLIIAAAASFKALADEPRSPLTDWNSSARRSQEEQAAQDQRAGAQRQVRARRDSVDNRLTGSMIEVGAGTENAIRSSGIDVDSGWNILISVRSQIDANDVQNTLIGRDDRGRLGDKRLMFLQVRGQVAIDPNSSTDRVPYLDFRIIPLSLTNVDDNALSPDNLFNEADEGDLTFLGINFGHMSIHRDVRLERDYRFAISAIGVDVRHREAITRNIDFVLAVAANIVGLRAQDNFTQIVRGRENLDLINNSFQPLSSDAAMSLLFHGSNRAWGARVTLGGSFSGGGTRTVQNDPRHFEETGRAGRSIFYQYDTSVFGEAALSVGRFVEIYTRIGFMHLRENGEYDAVQTRTITQFMTGASLQF